MNSFTLRMHQNLSASPQIPSLVSMGLLCDRKGVKGKGDKGMRKGRREREWNGEDSTTVVGGKTPCVAVLLVIILSQVYC